MARCRISRCCLLAASSLAAALLCGQAAADPECHCRANGESYLLGEQSCIKTNEGYRLARCAMALNNTTWQITGESCPSAGLESALRLAALPMSPLPSIPRDR